jgi:uncharacterized protein YndB with AHSA1/START domain
MPYVILKHKVKDYHIWRTHFDVDMERRLKGGFKNEKVYRDTEDPNLVYVTWDMDDTTGLNVLLHDPDLENVMKEAGVLTPPDVTILNET